MLKKFISVLLVLVILLSLTALPASAAEKEDPFYIGACAHNRGVMAYNNNLEDFVYYNAKMGSNFMRIDLSISTEDDYDYWDTFFALCKKYNTTVMGIVYSPLQAEIFSSRYGEQLKFLQMLNEEDTAAMNGSDGTTKDQYNINEIAETVGQLKEISAVIRENSPKTKLVVNGSFVHYGFFQHLIEQEVDFDVIGIDWYSHCDDWGFEKMLDELAELGKPIFVCEANIWQHDTDKSDMMGAKIIEYVEACKRKQKTNNILGLAIYELLDEPQKGTGPGEGIFGLIKINKDFTLGSPKSAYYEVQEYLGYKNKTVKKATVTNKDLDVYGPNPYEIKEEEESSEESVEDTTSDVSSTNKTTVTTTVVEPITTTQTETITDVSEVVDVVYEEPETIESVTTKNVYRTKGFPIWLIIEIIACAVVAAGGVVFFILINKPRKNKT